MRSHEYNCCYWVISFHIHHSTATIGSGASSTVWGHQTTKWTTTVSVHTNVKRWTFDGKFGQDSPCTPA